VCARREWDSGASLCDPRRCLPGPSPCPHGKTVHASTNQAIPPLSPAHTGHCARPGPSPTRENGMGKRARGLTVIPSAYSGRREALTPQYRASQSPVRACPESPETGSQASEHVASLWRGAPKPETQSQTTAYPRLHGGGGGGMHTRTKNNTCWPRKPPHLSHFYSVIYYVSRSGLARAGRMHVA
jgi:hypothetical protein